jgi:hypothetical protein
MSKLSQSQLKKYLNDFAELVRFGGWKVNIIEAEKVTPPAEDVLLFTVRFGKRK